MPQWQTVVPVSKAAYYDRNARPSYHTFGGTYAPHGTTIRVQYTAPYPYACFVESIFIYALRATAAAPVGPSTIAVVATNIYAVSVNILRLQFVDNTIGLTYTEQQSDFGIIFPGDTIDIRTIEGSTGGTVTMNGALKGCEFEY
jgi:hypothetical protein